MLIATTELQASISSLTNTFLNKLFGAGPDLTENNFKTDPPQRQAEAVQQFSNDLAKAVDTWLTSVIFQVQIGTLNTLGGPASQVNVSPGIITKT